MNSKTNIGISFFVFFFAIFLGLFYLTSKSNFFEINQIILFSSAFLSVLINGIIIFNSKIIVKKIFAILIYFLIVFSCLDFFKNTSFNFMYLIQSLCILFYILPSDSNIFGKYKFFNLGLLNILSVILYPPSVVILVFYLFIVILNYIEKINIIQYLIGLVFGILLGLEILYLTDQLSVLTHSLDFFVLPTFTLEIQIPIIVMLAFIWIYALYFHFYKNNSQDIEFNNLYSFVLFYLLGWIIIFSIFMENHFEMLCLSALAISSIVSGFFSNSKNTNYSEF